MSEGEKGYKTITRDVILDEFYETVDNNLSTEFGTELKKQRSVQEELKAKEPMKWVQEMNNIDNVAKEFICI